MQRGAEHTAFIKHLRKWDNDALFTAARAVRDLHEHRGWAVLTELLDDGREALESGMKYGQILDQGEYARRLGVIVGLESPRAALEAVLIYAESVEKAEQAELVEA